MPAATEDAQARDIALKQHVVHTAPGLFGEKVAMLFVTDARRS